MYSYIRDKCNPPAADPLLAPFRWSKNERSKIPPDIPSLAGIIMIHGISPKAGSKPTDRLASHYLAAYEWDCVPYWLIHRLRIRRAACVRANLYDRQRHWSYSVHMSHVPANEGAVAYLFAFVVYLSTKQISSHVFKVLSETPELDRSRRNLIRIWDFCWKHQWLWM